MGGHPFREAPPESTGAHCVRCGQVRPRAVLELDADGSVVCLECVPPATPLQSHANAKAVAMVERWTKMLVGIIIAIVTVLYVVTHSRR